MVLMWENTSTNTKYVTATTLNVRSGAGTNYSIIGSLVKYKSRSNINNKWMVKNKI